MSEELRGLSLDLFMCDDIDLVTTETIMENQALNFETKDSGKREQFEGGMVRDVQEGKPRFDLVFDGSVTQFLFYAQFPDKQEVIDAFFDWYTFPTLGHAVYVVKEIAALEGGTFEYLSRCSSLMIRGAVKYTEKNWMLAQGEAERKRFMSSACRHFGQYLCGDKVEDHAAAVWFNLNGYHYVDDKLAAAQ